MKALDVRRYDIDKTVILFIIGLGDYYITYKKCGNKTGIGIMNRY